uniref:Uncharacterized protein n=1 Tax=Anopheles dirus TaxID=7168 RepID=A0A182NW36_9DIPT
MALSQYKEQGDPRRRQRRRRTTTVIH